MAQRVQTRIEASDDSSLLALLGEELKQPLVAIAQMAELDESEEIQMQAKRALRTIDNVLLHRRIQTGQTMLQLEPVHVGSTMQAVQQEMKPLLKQQGCRTELHIRSGLQPVDVDRRVLHGMLQSLWQAFGSAIVDEDTINCSARKTKAGIRVTLTSDSADLKAVHFSKANVYSSQPLTAFAGPAADFLTAKELANILGVRISKTANSIGMTLPVSKQLQMV